MKGRETVFLEESACFGADSTAHEGALVRGTCGLKAPHPRSPASSTKPRSLAAFSSPILMGV